LNVVVSGVAEEIMSRAMSSSGRDARHLSQRAP
jgi:hypothetical protein